MKCTMTFSDKCYDAERDCIREECAWWVMQQARPMPPQGHAQGVSIPGVGRRGRAGQVGPGAREGGSADDGGEGVPDVLEEHALPGEARRREVRGVRRPAPVQEGADARTPGRVARHVREMEGIRRR